MKNSDKKTLLIITFLSGFSFLIYEVAWNRFLSLKLGATVIASTIVLMAFMTGMGLGAYFIGKKVNDKTNLGKYISGILSGISLFSILNYFLIDNLPNIYSNFIQSIIAIDIFLFISTFILLLIPAFFMGGIIPIANKIISQDNKNIPKNIGLIYASETIGSAVGGLVTGFILLGKTGQFQTIIIAGIINIIVSGLILFSKKYTDIPNFSHTISHKHIKGNSDNSKHIAFLSTFFIGFLIISLQVIWIRVFKTYFTNTSYTFSLIASFVIVGLSIGSWLFKQKEHKIKSNDKLLFRLIFLMTFVSAIGLLFMVYLPEIFMKPFKEASSDPFFRLIFIPFLSSVFIVLPPAIVSGFLFPLTLNMYSNGAENLSKNIGKMMLVNTLGTVVGPAITTFILIPIIGAGKSLLFLIFVISTFSFFIIKKHKIEIKLYKQLFITLSVLSVFIITFASKIQFLAPSIKIFNKEVVVYQETLEGTIIITNEPQKGIFGKNTYIDNSTVIGSNYDAIKAVKMVGHLPFFIGTQCENVLIIGFGIGVTTSAIAQHKEVKKIDCVELVPGLVKNANYYSDFNMQVYNDKRLNIIPGDGRHFLQITTNKYDLISCDPTHPVLGSGGLYTKDYFQEVYDHLTINGVTSQYLPLHKLNLNDLLGIIKTFNSVFENAYVWLGQYHAILLGTKNNEKIDFDKFKEKIYEIPFDDFLYLEPYHIASSVIFDKNSINNFSADLKINTDNLNYTEFFSFSSFDGNNIYNNLDFFNSNRCNVYDVYKNITNNLLMDKFYEGNKLLTESFYYSLKDDTENAKNSLIEAVNVNPENKELTFLLKLYYGIEL